MNYDLRVYTTNELSNIPKMVVEFACTQRWFLTPNSLSITSNPRPYSGTIAATLLQKSHLMPLPPSHVYAFTSVKLFRSPAPPLSVKFFVELETVDPLKLTGEPPVWFRSSWYGA